MKPNDNKLHLEFWFLYKNSTSSSSSSVELYGRFCFRPRFAEHIYTERQLHIYFNVVAFGNHRWSIIHLITLLSSWACRSLMETNFVTKNFDKLSLTLELISFSWKVKFFKFVIPLLSSWACRSLMKTNCATKNFDKLSLTSESISFSWKVKFFKFVITLLSSWACRSLLKTVLYYILWNYSMFIF